MTAKDFYEWVKEYNAENYLMKIEHDEKKAHLCEIDDEEKKIIIYTK